MVLEWQAEPHHEAFTGMVNGGIVGALFDCHSNWTAAWHLVQPQGATEPPSAVTAEVHVKLRKPTSSKVPLQIRAKVVESSDTRATIEAVMTSQGSVTATCRGVFVAVQEGHPA